MQVLIERRLIMALAITLGLADLMTTTLGLSLPGGLVYERYAPMQAAWSAAGVLGIVALKAAALGVWALLLALMDKLGKDDWIFRVGAYGLIALMILVQLPTVIDNLRVLGLLA